MARFERNYTSQAGEDGVLEHLVDLLPERSHWCVEFGAWDGKHCSNTYSLIKRAGYSAVLIEPDAVRFAELLRNHADSAHVLGLQRFVEAEGEHSLDSILAETPIPRGFDLLSIDIDGNDYHIWDSLTLYRPKIVVIEYNPTIPAEVEFVQPRNPNAWQGASLRSLTRLASAKGYRIVHATALNGIFLDETCLTHLEIPEDPETLLRCHKKYITYLFQGFDGTLHLAGHKQLPWHGGMPIEESQLQVLPRFLRSYPPRYSAAQRVAWKFWIAYRKVSSALQSGFK